MTTYTIGKFDAGGYYVVMEDDVVLCRTKSLRTARRIAVALASPPAVDDAVMHDFISSDSKGNQTHCDTTSIVELKPAVAEGEDW